VLQDITITVTNINDAPSNLILSNTEFVDGQDLGTVVGFLSSEDDDGVEGTGDNHTYSLISGEGSTDNNAFTINGSELRSGQVFDANAKSAYQIRVQTRDLGGLTFQKIFDITIIPNNQSPTALSLSANDLNTMD